MKPNLSLVEKTKYQLFLFEEVNHGIHVGGEAIGVITANMKPEVQNVYEFDDVKYKVKQVYQQGSNIFILDMEKI